MAPAGSDFQYETSTTASAAAFRFHFRPRPTLPDVYLWPDQSEPGTRALPTITGPPSDAEGPKWSR